MSESDYVEPSSESFWEIGQYKRTVKRAEDGHKLCGDIVQMISERADLEKAYSKSLKAWSKKWSDYLNKGNEYGSMKSGWQASLVEADKLSEIHLSTHNALNDELNREIKDWQKHNYQKTLVGQLKIAKEYEEEFKKAQKPWSKKYFLVEKTKKEYHGACKSYQSAKIHLQNSQADPQISAEQRKKLEDKVEKYKKEVEVAKNKYKQALDDLNSYNSRYIEDMNNVYKKCDQFEKERLEFFIQQLLKLHTHLNIFDKMNIEQIYAEFMSTIKQTSPDKDLHTWSKECGAGMAMSWPVFEEYSDQIKQIAKNRKKSDKEPTEGITMTSIRPIDDAETKSLSSELSNYRSEHTNGPEINGTLPKHDIKILTNGSGSIRSALKPSTTNTQSATSIKQIEYPVEQNPFGEEGETADEVRSDNNCTLTSKQNNPTHSPLSVNVDSVKNEINNFQPSSGSSSNNTSNDAPMSNNSAEFNPFGNEEEEITEAQETNKSDDEVERTVYLNVRVKALYDYHSAEDDELSFKAGEEMIKLANEDKRGWCLGKIGDKIGLYPATYATEI